MRYQGESHSSLCGTVDKIASYLTILDANLKRLVCLSLADRCARHHLATAADDLASA